MYRIIGFQHKEVFWEVVEALGNEASLEEVGHYEGFLETCYVGLVLLSSLLPDRP